MLRSFLNGLSKHVGIWRINHQHRLVLASQLHTWQGPTGDQAVIAPPKLLDSVGLHQQITESDNVLPSLERNPTLPGKGEGQVNVSMTVACVGDFFNKLFRMLAEGNVPGMTMWHFVDKSSSQLSPPGGYALTQSEKNLLGHVLHRILDDWAAHGINKGTSHMPIVLVIRTYVARKYMRLADWVYCLSFLAKNSYQKINQHKEQPNETSVNDQIAHAVQIRVLCKAWKIFFLGEYYWTSESLPLAGQDENLWPNLRKGLALPHDAGTGTDFVQQFMQASGKLYLSDPNLDRELAYSSMLTVVIIYNNLRSFQSSSVDTKKDTSTSFGNDNCASGTADNSETPPDWRLQLEQSRDWTPEIGHLSRDEASLLYIVAHAANDATLNLTLLRIKLAQLSLSARDVNEIARISQIFKSGVPTLLRKFQTFKYDANAHNQALLRRYPFKAYLERAVASNDAKALDEACSIATKYAGAIKTVLDVFAACLETGSSRRALIYWDMLASRVTLRKRAWKIWLNVAFQKKDLVAFETAWDKSRTHRLACTARLWHQRLLLHHQSNQPLAAWEHFCTLVRLSEEKQEMVRTNSTGIAPPSILNIETCHMMINALLSGEDAGKAADVLQLLKEQERLGVTRETYLFFIEHSFRRGTRQSAVEWFIEGHSLHVKFLPEDYAILFEYDLVKFHPGKGRHLSDPASKLRLCYDAISETMHLVRSRQSSKSSSSYSPPFSNQVEAILRGMPLVDSVVDDHEDPSLTEIQAVYAGIMERLAQNLPEQSDGPAKFARLRLLLLLWDHCVITGIPASTQMEATLRSAIHSLHPKLQEYLIGGAMFSNVNIGDPVSFYSYRFLRVIGPCWFTDRVRSIPSGPTKTRLTRLEWRGYKAVTDVALANVGISSWQDRRRILAEIKTWMDDITTHWGKIAKEKAD